jgi:hypothetical protein
LSAADERFPNSGWPKWLKRDIAWVAGLTGTVLAVMGLLFPDLTTKAKHERLGAICFSFATTLAIAIIIYVLRIAFSASQKSLSYGRLFCKLEQTTKERDVARQTTLNYAQQDNPYELDRVLMHKNEIFVVIRKKSRPKLNVGTRVTILDTGDGAQMGNFVITEVRHADYYARSDDFIDAVWEGFLRREGKTEHAAPPRCFAYVIPNEEISDE